MEETLAAKTDAEDVERLKLEASREIERTNSGSYWTPRR